MLVVALDKDPSLHIPWKKLKKQLLKHGGLWATPARATLLLSCVSVNQLL